MTMNELAERYVKLTLAVGQHHDYYIDAYYGPEAWREQDKQPLGELLQLGENLHADLAKIDATNHEKSRHEFLTIQTESVLFFIKHLQGEQFSFDEESKALYDAISPTIDESEFDQALAELDDLLPGDGPLNQRMAVFSKQFEIPKDKLDTVFRAAIKESRQRTRQFIDLPTQENFTLEYVTDKVWSGYNWYKGNSFSLIQMNTDFPITIDRAIDLASHEGYPGHHVFNSLMEKHLVNANGWIEYSVYPLFSPMSLLAEGSANYGIDVAFPEHERIAFEKEVLFPLAGLDSSKVDLYYAVQAVRSKLSYIDNVVAKRYLDGQIDKQTAQQMLMKYALSSEQKALQRIGFIEQNRAYVINYNLGQDIVRDYVEQLSKGNAEKRWQVFSELLAYPKTASMMRH
ncbi:hypothetical protein E8M12_08230 [Thalassotalea mangrovi]|uniref:DUF885 domain-containing protein n=1 Tax=Thalassotalea mangrovi TaxID=2572245 RepID=A0A4U1B5E3_9GAMM|nr:hypothetical protein E8M12_08230 [Thalassotalea mangrovi]